MADKSTKTYTMPKETGVDTTWAYTTDANIPYTSSTSPTTYGQDLTRLAGGLGALFSPTSSSLDDYIKESTKALEKSAKDLEKKISATTSTVYPGLTGLTGEELIAQFYQGLADTTSALTAQGNQFLGASPSLGTEYDRLNTRVDDIQNQYSLANQLGGYSTIASQGAPPGQVTTIDVASIRDVADWVDPVTNQIKDKYKAYYDYSDPQTQQFIYGSRERPAAVAGFYANSGDVAGLMNYGSVSM